MGNVHETSDSESDSFKPTATLFINVLDFNDLAFLVSQTYEWIQIAYSRGSKLELSFSTVLYCFYGDF
jgi:hypothetical protein